MTQPPHQAQAASSFVKNVFVLCSLLSFRLCNASNERCERHKKPFNFYYYLDCFRAAQLQERHKMFFLFRLSGTQSSIARHTHVDQIETRCQQRTAATHSLRSTTIELSRRQSTTDWKMKTFTDSNMVHLHSAISILVWIGGLRLLTILFFSRPNSLSRFL